MVGIVVLISSGLCLLYFLIFRPIFKIGREKKSRIEYLEKELKHFREDRRDNERRRKECFRREAELDEEKLKMREEKWKIKEDLIKEVENAHCPYCGFKAKYIGNKLMASNQNSSLHF